MSAPGRVLDPARFDRHFLVPGAEGLKAYGEVMEAARATIATHYAPLMRPFSGIRPEELVGAIAALDPCPEWPVPLAEALDWAGRVVLANSVVVAHPACVAHLHCPPLLSALAAEALAAAANQSMDSWDQAPAATLIEQRVIDWLCELFGYADSGDGTFTSGGTQSNFMGLMLARDTFCRRVLGWNVQAHGLPPEASRMRIFCSEAAHFTVKQSAALLGLGHQAVIPVAVDAGRRIDLVALERELAACLDGGLLPFMIVGTAGTTDFGSIDPLAELAAIARTRGLWFHVDAAYGGAVRLSKRHQSLLEGIEQADSLTIDFHKLFYQPIACGAFLSRNREAFDLMRLHADYLNPEDNEEEGYPDLVTKSIQTTRRFDALKLLLSLRAIGRTGFEAMLDATIALAAESAAVIAADPRLALIQAPVLNAVVFRLVDRSLAPERLDGLNRAIRLALLREGSAVIAQTKVDGRVCLKLTLLNPRTTLSDVQGILDRVKHHAGAIAREAAAP